MNSVIGNPPEESECKEIEVSVSVTLSKTFKIPVNDYNIINGELDFSNCNLYKALISSVYMPYEAYRYIDDSDIKEDLKDWNIDDLEVVLDD